MFDRITYISNDGCTVKLANGGDVSTNLMNLHLVFEDDAKKVLGEVDDIDGDTLKAKFLGEIAGDKLIGGNIRKPSLDAKIRVIDKSEIPLITGTDTDGYMLLGQSPLYDGVPVFLNVNSFFSNHFAIFGNTGSGKSCGVSRLFQNMFHDQRLNPYKANMFIFDSSGEYYNAFSNLTSINSSYNYRFISTNEVEGLGEKLRLPVYLLNKDDLALLLQCTSHSQLPIIERMLKLALVFSQNDVDAQAYKNHLIAKAIMSILYTNETSPNKRNEIISILGSCSTDEFNLEAPVQGIGYVRKFRECFLIDNSGNFSESVLLTEYVNSFIKEEFDSYEPHTGVFYNLDTLEKALNFTLISEGWLRNEQTYGDSVTLRVRLHALIVGDNAKYFDVSDYVSLETYLSSLLIDNGRKFQIVNINLSDIDDDFAKVLVKIYSRLIFDFSKALKNRGSIPFHIVLEEAHRYIQSDKDRFLFGYNIFERIAKEGRKYGVILGIITQRPVELSDNVISQCTNFLIFKINHPLDIKYIREMVPHITDEIIEKQKSLQPGTCLGFGLGFKIPLIVKMEMPNPSPLSGNCDVVNIWCGKSSGALSAPASVQPSMSMNAGNVDLLNSTAIPAFNKPENPAPKPVDVIVPEVAPADNKDSNFNNNLINIVDAPKEEEKKPAVEEKPKEEKPVVDVPKDNPTSNLINIVDAPKTEEKKPEVKESDIPALIDITDSPKESTEEKPAISDLVNIVDAPKEEEKKPAVEEKPKEDKKTVEPEQTSPAGTQDAFINNKIDQLFGSTEEKTDTPPIDSSIPVAPMDLLAGSGLSPQVDLSPQVITAPLSETGAVPEISSVDINDNGMVNTGNSGGNDLTLDDDGDDDLNNDFDD